MSGPQGSQQSEIPFVARTAGLSLTPIHSCGSRAGVQRKAGGTQIRDDLLLQTATMQRPRSEPFDAASIERNRTAAEVALQGNGRETMRSSTHLQPGERPAGSKDEIIDPHSSERLQTKVMAIRHQTCRCSREDVDERQE